MRSFLQALADPGFGDLVLESEGKELKSLNGGKVGSRLAKATHVTIKRPFEGASPFKINRVNMTWSIQKDTEKPAFRFVDIKEVAEGAQGDIIMEADDLAPGLYRGILSIESTWGDVQLPVEFERILKPARMPQIAAAILVLISFSILLLWKMLTPTSKTEIYRRWNGDNWPTLMMKIPNYLLPRFSINHTDKWQIYQDVQGIVMKVTRDELIISGTSSQDETVRTGWISRFFRPVGNMSVAMTLSRADKKPYRCRCDDFLELWQCNSG